MPAEISVDHCVSSRLRDIGRSPRGARVGNRRRCPVCTGAVCRSPCDQGVLVPLRPITPLASPVVMVGQKKTISTVTYPKVVMVPSTPYLSHQIAQIFPKLPFIWMNSFYRVFLSSQPKVQSRSCRKYMLLKPPLKKRK